MQEKAHFLRTTNIVFYEIQGGMNHFKEVCFAAYTGNPLSKVFHCRNLILLI